MKCECGMTLLPFNYHRRPHSWEPTHGCPYCGLKAWSFEPEESGAVS